MAETKHTPTEGPWVCEDVSELIGHNEFKIRAPKSDLTIAYVSWADDRCNPPYEQQLANGRQLAAAPELLAASQSAEELLCIYGDAPEGAVEQCLAKLRAAIAKAKGESE